MQSVVKIGTGYPTNPATPLCPFRGIIEVPALSGLKILAWDLTIAVDLTPDERRSSEVFLFLPVVPFVVTELCWFALKSARPNTRLSAYVVCTAAALTLGSWLIGVSYERSFEARYTEGGHGKIGDAWASHIVFGTVVQVASGMLALLCVSWGTRALVRSWTLMPAALVLYFLALPLAFLSFLAMYGANSW